MNEQLDYELRNKEANKGLQWMSCGLFMTNLGSLHTIFD